MKQIYNNLYQDEDTEKYFFVFENDVREVVEQQSYILIYILEMMMKEQELNKEKVFNLGGQNDGNNNT